MSEAHQDPFQSSTHTNPFEAIRVTHFPERDAISPSFYDWKHVHPNPQTITVTQNGEPVSPGFTVAQVAPEFRWAIHADGELFDQLEFEQLLERAREEYFTFIGKPVTGHPDLRPRPRVERWVAHQVDPDDVSRTIPIEPAPPADKPTLTHQYTADGDPVPVDVNDPRTREIASKHGLILPESVKPPVVEQEESPDVAALRAEVAKMAEVRAELEALKAEAAAQAAKPPKKKRKAPMWNPHCGAEQVYAIHKNIHIKKCDECQSHIDNQKSLLAKPASAQQE